MNSVFDHKTHYSLLQWRLNPQNSSRGIKSKFSESLRIQPTYLSQVLSEKFPLSLEQAALANLFFEHSADESDYFLTLVSHDRAGSQILKKYFQNKLQVILLKRQELVERLGKKQEISDEAKSIYYSSWLYSAVHVGCTIEHLQTRSAIMEKFSIPQELAERILEFLTANQIIVKDGDRYKTTQNWVRLDRSSPHIGKHQSNWRNKAIQNLDVQTLKDLHFSGVYSADQKAMDRLRDNFMDFLKAELKNLEAAKEEELFVVNADIFKLLKNA